MTTTIQITEAARQRMHEFLAKKPEAIAIRFGVKPTGCSGFGYTVDLTETVTESDHIIEQSGLKLVIDAKSWPFVQGTEIDFQRSGLNATFVFRNPNATGECGCGESFTVAAAN